MKNILTVYRSIFSECIRRNYQGDKLGSKKLFSELLSIVKTTEQFRATYGLFEAISTRTHDKILSEISNVQKIPTNDIINQSTFLKENFKSVVWLKENKSEHTIITAIFNKRTLVKEDIEKLLPVVSEQTIDTSDLKVFNDDNFTKFAVAKFNAQYSKILTKEEKELFNILFKGKPERLKSERKQIVNRIYNYKNILSARGDLEAQVTNNIDKFMAKLSGNMQESILKLVEFENLLIEAINE